MSDFLQRFPAGDSITLDPLFRQALDAQAPFLAPVEQFTPAGIRQLLETLTRMTPPLAEPVERVETLEIGGTKARLFRPAAGRLPVVLYLHGGGWVAGSLDTCHDCCQSIAARSGAAVLAIDYRLAPEFPFPVPLDDCYRALEWVASDGAKWNLDGSRIAVCGDSAGGNLSAAVALRARDEGGPGIAAQILINPALDFDFETASYLENAEGFGLTRAIMMWFARHYLPDWNEARNPLAAPLRAASMKGLPPALIQTAGFDPLRDEGEAYARRLRDAGVPAAASRYQDMAHNFINAAGVYASARRALDEAAAAVRAAFGGQSSRASG